MKKKIILFLIKLFRIKRSQLVQWTDIRNGNMRYELILTEYDLATMEEGKLLRIKHLLEELGFGLTNN